MVGVSMCWGPTGTSPLSLYSFFSNNKTTIERKQDLLCQHDFAVRTVFIAYKMLGKIDLRGGYHPCPAGEDRLPSAFKSSSVSFPALWAKQMDAWMDGVGVAIVTIIPWSSCLHLSFYHSWGEKPTARCRGTDIRWDLHLSDPAGASIPLQQFSNLTFLIYILWIVSKIQT